MIRKNNPVIDPELYEWGNIEDENGEVVDKLILMDVVLESGKRFISGVKEKEICWVNQLIPTKSGNYVVNKDVSGGVFYIAPKGTLSDRIVCYNRETKHGLFLR